MRATGACTAIEATTRPETETPQFADRIKAMAQQMPGTPARKYVGWWEVRNLRMAANIRAAFAGHPGARVLNVVGASHKPWYDLLIGTMADVEVVDSAAVLR